MLSYVLAGVGMSLAVSSMAVLMKRSLDHRAANKMFVKLATSGNVDRMRKLARVAGKATYFEAIVAALDAGAAAQTREPAALEEVVEAAYDKAGAEVAASWKAHAERGLFGVILVGVGFGLAVSDESVPTPLLVLSGAGALVGLYLAAKRRSVVEALIAGREMILPPLVAALAMAPEAVTARPAPLPATPATPATPETEGPLSAGEVRVRIYRDDTFVRSQSLDGTVTKVGKITAAHLHLDDEKVSRMHAIIERGEDGVLMIDLGSSTGTRVNGEKVNRATLRSGDVVEIGPFRLEIEIGTSDTLAN